MIVKLTHPKETHDLWVDLNEIIIMERKKKVKSVILQTDDDQPALTFLVLKSGKTITCLETCEEIMDLVDTNTSTKQCKCS